MLAKLFDVNVLVALLNENHPFHGVAKAEFRRASAWATCPITELGTYRVLMHPSVAARTAHEISVGINRLKDFGSWRWIPCDISPSEASHVGFGFIPNAKSTTDAYLLALCAHHNLEFVTLDQRIQLDWAPSAQTQNLKVLIL